MSVIDVLLAAGAATRLTRFVVTEDLGGWLIRDPANRWADRYEPTVDGVPVQRAVAQGHVHTDRALEPGWRSRLVSGLDCPFCVGTWLHIAAQASTTILPRTGPLRAAWRVVAGGLTASYLLAHLAVTWGDVNDDDEDYDAPIENDPS